MPILPGKEGYGCRCTDARKHFWTGTAGPGHFWSRLWNNRHSDSIVETSRLHGTYLSQSLWNRALDQVIQGSIKLSPVYFQWRKLRCFPCQPVSVFHCSVSWAQLPSHSRTWFLSNMDMVSAHCFSLTVSFLQSWTAESQLLGVVLCFWDLLHWEWAVLLSGKDWFPKTLWLCHFVVGRIRFFLALLRGRYCGNCSLPSRCSLFNLCTSALNGNSAALMCILYFNISHYVFFNILSVIKSFWEFLKNKIVR